MPEPKFSIPGNFSLSPVSDNWLICAEDVGGGLPVLRVKLIDFGRARSIWATEGTVGGSTSTAQPQQQQHQLSAQVTQLRRFYNCTNSPWVASNSRGEVTYTGDISCKTMKCHEVQQGLPWSFQVLYLVYSLFAVCSTVFRVTTKYYLLFISSLMTPTD